jgi:hypothetical protein
VLLAGAAAATAAAGPFFNSSVPKIARPGAVITLRAGLGVRVRDGMPVYLVPSNLAPRPFLCQNGRGYCTPMSRRAPTSTPYTRIATLNVDKAPGTPASGYTVTIRYRIPQRMSPGRYAYVLYCRWCGRPGLGSLVAWPTQPFTGKPRNIPIGAALIIG